MIEKENNDKGDEWVTYAFVVRATKNAVIEIANFLDALPNSEIIYQKSSRLKLYIKEDVF
ncbi:MAG: hypothetical protein QME47_08240 [Candidatus Thermoplasmatota archaeon]|nr:hypothetical protein [Candidatus Thermoplasmatota archaeon]